MKWQTRIQLGLVLLVALLTISCDPDKNVMNRRIAYQNEATGDILVGINWPFSKFDDKFREGILLAQKEINESGGILGRKLVLDIRNNHGDINRGRAIAHEFAHNKKMSAVIGHAYSNIAVETAVIYEEAGLLCLSPRAQLTTLTQHDMRLFFRTSPGNKDLGQAAAEFTYLLNFRQPVVIMASDEYSKELTNCYRTSLANLGIEIVYTFYYFPWNTDYRAILSEMEHMDYDVIFVSMDGEDVVDFTRKARLLGADAPILLINSTTDDFIAHLGTESNNTYNVSYFNPSIRSESVTHFMRAFREQYDTVPDNWAAKGYDTLKLFADMVTKTNSTNSFEVAANLHYLKGWKGINGTYDFTVTGDVHVKPLFLEMINNEKIEFFSTDDFPKPTLQSKLERVFSKEIKDGEVEVSVKGNVLSIALSEPLLFGDQLTSLNYEGRTALDAIAAAYLGDQRSHSLHVMGQIDYETIILEEGIGSHTDTEVAELRSMAVGTYLVSQGVSSKELFVQGADLEDRVPDNIIPIPNHLTGDRIEILFVRDDDLEAAKK